MARSSANGRSVPTLLARLSLLSVPLLAACGGAPHEPPAAIREPFSWAVVPRADLGFVAEMPVPEPVESELHEDARGRWVNHSYLAAPAEGIAFQLTIQDYAAYPLREDVSADELQAAACDGASEAADARVTRFEPAGATPGAGFECEFALPDGSFALARTRWSADKRLYMAVVVCVAPMCAAHAAEVRRFLSSLRVGAEGTVAPPPGPTTNGGLSPQSVRYGVREIFPSIRACYEGAEGALSRLAGHVDVRFEIRADGRVREGSVEVARSTMQAPAFTDCVLASVRRARFEANPSGEPTEVVYPFIFRPSEESAPADGAHRE